MNTKKTAFIIGLVFLLFALLSITVFPALIQKFTSFHISQYFYAQIEFYLLFLCAGLYAYSTEYYEYQLYSIMGVVAFYVMFVRAFH